MGVTMTDRYKYKYEDLTAEHTGVQQHLAARRLLETDDPFKWSPMRKGTSNVPSPQIFQTGK